MIGSNLTTHAGDLAGHHYMAAKSISYLSIFSFIPMLRSGWWRKLTGPPTLPASASGPLLYGFAPYCWYCVYDIIWWSALN